MKLLTLFLFAIAQLIALCAAGAPSIYWDFPHYLNYTAARARIEVLEGKHTGIYFGTSYQFSAGAVASGLYIGLQPRTNSTNHLVFSAFGQDAPAWDPNRCGNGADGSAGISCSYDWPWEFNVTYFTEVVLADTTPDGNHTWVGSLVNEATGESIYIANFTTPSDWGLLQGGAVSFDEYYGYTYDVETPVQHCEYYTSAIIWPPELTYLVDGVETNITAPILSVVNTNDTSGNNTCSPTNESGQRGYYLPDGAFKWENGLRDSY